MRRANGTGSIVKLSGNRRRPYLVKIDLHPVADGALIELGGVNGDAISHGAVPHHGVGAHLAVPADDGLPP